MEGWGVGRWVVVRPREDCNHTVSMCTGRRIQLRMVRTSVCSALRRLRSRSAYLGIRVAPALCSRGEPVARAAALAAVLMDRANCLEGVATRDIVCVYVRVRCVIGRIGSSRPLQWVGFKLYVGVCWNGGRWKGWNIRRRGEEGKERRGQRGKEQGGVRTGWGDI